MAAVVVDETVTTTVEVTFHVKDGTDSPYPGRLVFTAVAYAALTQGQVRAREIQQYNDWKQAQVVAPSAHPKKDKQDRLAEVRSLKVQAAAEEIDLVAEIAAMPDDPPGGQAQAGKIA